MNATPGRRYGSEAVVRAIRLHEGTLEVAEIEDNGGPPEQAMARAFRPDRIQMVAQTRDGSPAEVRRDRLVQ